MLANYLTLNLSITKYHILQRKASSTKYEDGSLLL